MSAKAGLDTHVEDRNYTLLKQNPRHPSLYFNKIGAFHAIRVGLRHRALAIEDGHDLIWFWIGSHANYDDLIGADRPSPEKHTSPET